MIPVYQDKFIHIDGTGNCMNACVASLLERPLRDVASIDPYDPGVWFLSWRKWLKAEGYDLEMVSSDCPPTGYGIVSVETDRVYPEGHPEAGQHIPHACVVFDGMMVHDPYPKTHSYGVNRIHHYYKLTPIR